LSIEIVSELTQDDLDPRNKPYQPINGFLELFEYKGEEILLSGGAGTGKTTACLSKCFMLAEMYPNCRILFLRKHRESMTQSLLEPFENNVVPEGHPCLSGPSRETRKEYKFPNGSCIVIGGLRQSDKNNVQKVMGPNYDFVYVSEAIELTQEEWEKAGSRLRNFKAPYQQLMADTNPSYPHHWLKQRCDKGVCKIVYTFHEDNAVLYDNNRKEWTQSGMAYMARLDKFTGVQRERFLKGKWVQAEGSVYADFDHRRHTIDPFIIPNEWKKIRVVDFGYNDPFCCLWTAQDPQNGKLYVYREYVKTRGLVEDHARAILALENETEKIKDTVCDHDAEDRATLEKYLKCSTIPADKRKDKKFGIGEVQSRLRNLPDGEPGLQIFKSLYGQYDEHMAEKKVPIGLLSEIDAYVWNSTKDKPMDGNDHGADCLAYTCTYFLNNSTKWVPPDAMKTPEPIPTFQRPRGPLSNMPQFRRNNQSPFGR
jgi:PBSX family phage terminase large subunit